jgi:general stress protein 26
VRKLIQWAAVGMLMTNDEHGAAFGRPMRPLLLDNDSHIYFLTHQNSRKVRQVAARPQIELTMGWRRIVSIDMPPAIASPFE